MKWGQEWDKHKDKDENFLYAWRRAVVPCVVGAAGALPRVPQYSALYTQGCSLLHLGLSE